MNTSAADKAPPVKTKKRELKAADVPKVIVRRGGVVIKAAK